MARHGISKIKTKHLIAIVAIALGGLLIWRVTLLLIKEFGGGTQRSERPPVAVQVGDVLYEPIKETLQLTGTIHPLYQYTVAPKVSGRIVSITKRIGDHVGRGETIARIDDGEYRQALLQAQAELRIAQANLVEAESQMELKRKEMERVQSMEAKGIASRAELDQATAQFTSAQAGTELARAQIEQREAALATAQIRLDYTVLTAPQPGLIGERFVDEGTLVAANSEVASVVGIDRVIVQTTVIERVYGRIAPGQPAEVEVDAFPGKTFTGSVSRVAPMLDEASRVAQMEVEIPNDSLQLKPGMFCKVTVTLSSKDSAQVVPGQAIVTRNGSTGIFVVKAGENVARYVPVQIGITTPERTEIISPKIDGAVVSLGQHLLQDGSAVILPDASKRQETAAPDSRS
jgi:RND family efflux transporter MFP subunit